MSGRGRGRGAGGRGGARGGAKRGGRGGAAAGRGGSRGGGRGGARGGAPRGRGAAPRGRGAPARARPGLGATRPREEEVLAPVNVQVDFEVLSPSELKSMKGELLNTVAAALINEPKPSATNPVFVRILELSKRIAFYDPEFVLKLAVYVRDDLGIRSTANYLLAMAANIKECQPFLRKYFKHAIRLPSDWLDVAATYQTLPDKTLNGNSLPTSLRKAMVEKFTDFDSYQLGKYNKERNIKRKQKKQRGLAAAAPAAPVTADGAVALTPFPRPAKPMLTLKQMIRQLHISHPNGVVMSILGKKYPLTMEEFRNAGLPGNFDPAKSGSRMKLPTPETWETLLSEKGNKASTWEELMQHKKLPFMAMLRNLRNLILTGVQPRWHKWVMSKLKNEDTIVNSRQFPFRFFSAYEVIPRDLEHFKQLVQQANTGAAPAEGEEPKDEGEEKKARRKRKKPIVPAVTPASTIFAEYRAALDTAVKLATTHNVSPIKGSTVVFCNVSSETKGNAPSAKGLGSSVRNIQEVGYLLGLMCKYVCEECDFRIYSSTSTKHPDVSHISVQLVEGTILDNMKVVAEKAKELGEAAGEFPFAYIEDLVSQKKKVDNLLVLSHKPLGGTSDDASSLKLSNLLAKYRQEVNPELLFVCVDLSGTGRSNIKQDQAHPYDIQISGFSDQILRFIAERGDNNQLQYVEHIDDAKGINKALQDKAASAEMEVSPWWRWLESLGKEAPEGPKTYPNVTTRGAWRECRVFISSTFLDMHGERDVLTRIVFPELKDRLKKRRVNLFEVDLRWGVTEEESQHGKSIELCLDEVQHCSPFFIGLLGERYGWAPTKYDVADDPRFDWLKNYPAGRSITELEMQLAALSNPANATGSFFYLRDKSFLKNVPDKFKRAFEDTDKDAKQKLADLKARIVASGLPCVQNYGATWKGEDEEGKPLTGGLEAFAQQVFEDLWGAISAAYPEEDAPADELVTERSYHQAFVEERTRRFVGRQEQLAALTKFANAADGPKLMTVAGVAGEGKSSLMAEFARDFAEKTPNVFVLPHFIGASPASTDVRKLLHRLCGELKEAFDLPNEAAEDYQDLLEQFPEFLKEAAYKGRLVLIIDAVNQLDNAIHRSHSLDWLPTELPCKVIVSTIIGHRTEAVLNQRKPSSVKMTQLSVPERTELVKQTLAEYHKKLDERPMNNQMRVLLRKVDAGKPLYLTVACEELRVFGVYELVSDKIKDMGPQIAKLFDGVLQRLEADHGKDLVETVMSTIACSRGGIPLTELVEIITESESLAAGKWEQLYRSLGAFLKPSGEGDVAVINFFHEQLEIAVEKRYLKKPKVKTNTHRKIADYFLRISNEGGAWQPIPRAISELPFHLLNGAQWDKLEAVLSDLKFIELKCALDMTYDLVEDLTEATRDPAPAASSSSSFSSFGSPSNASPVDIPAPMGVEEYPGKKVLREFLSFVKGSAHVLANNSALAFQQARNQPDDSTPAKLARELWKSRAKNTALAQSEWLKWANKPQAHDFCKMNFSGFADDIISVAYSPDGQYLAMGSKDCSVKLYNAATGTEIASLTGHSNWVVALSFSYDSRQLVSGSWDCSLKIWDLYLLAETATLEGHKRRINDCCFSNDGCYILSASWDCSLILWDVSAAKQKKLYRNFDKPINACCFSPDDKQIACGLWDGSVRIVERESSTVLFNLKNSHTNSVSSIAWSSTGKQLATASRDKTIVLWDAKAGKAVTSLKSHNRPVNSVAFSDDGMHLVSASDDCTIKVWDANLGKEKQSLVVPTGYMNAVAFHPTDPSRIATGSSECSIAVWDIIEARELIRMEGHTRAINCVDFSADGTVIASCADEGDIFLWNSENGQLNRKLEGHKHPVSWVGFSPVKGDTRLASASDDFTIRIWDYKSGETTITLKGHESAVKSVNWSANGKFVVSGSRDRTIRVWDSRNGNCIHTWLGHKDWLNTVSFSPDAKFVLSGSWDYNMKVWSLRKDGEVATLMGHEGALCQARYFPSGKHIISAAFDGGMKIWDAESYTEITSLPGHRQRINGLAISSDGKLVATVSDDATIKIWDPLASSELHTLIGHSRSVRKVAFAPKTKQIVSAADDGTVKVWDVAIGVKESDSFSSGFNFSSFSSSFSTTSDSMDVEKAKDAKAKHVLPLAAHNSQINDLAVTEDGQVLLSASDDGSCAYWDLNLARKLRIMRHKDEEKAMRACALAPGSNLVATASDEGTLYLWDLRAKKRVLIFNIDGTRSHRGPVTCANFSSTGQEVVSGGWDNTVRLWDVRTGKQRSEHTQHSDWVLCAKFAPNSARVATGGWDKVVKLWDSTRGSHLSAPAHNAYITDCAFSLDNTYFASCDSEGGINVRTTANPEALVTGWEHAGTRINKLAFVGGRGQTRLIAAASDGITVFDVHNKNMVCQFFTQASATALTIANVKGGRPQTMVGDTIGNIYILNSMTGK